MKQNAHQHSLNYIHPPFMIFRVRNTTGELIKQKTTAMHNHNKKALSRGHEQQFLIEVFVIRNHSLPYARRPRLTATPFVGTREIALSVDLKGFPIATPFIHLYLSCAPMATADHGEQ